VLLKVDDDRAGAAEFVRDFVERTAILRYEAAIPDGYVVTAADAAEWTVLGSPDECADRLQSYLDAGATSLGIVVMGPAQEMLEAVLVSLGL
jgi:alkanesulfonate monooxygenase SsuD/methylene tetrahydromethanopterin reductase-like flavin-dependent oxidoreductase (luciferase family)